MKSTRPIRILDGGNSIRKYIEEIKPNGDVT